MASEPRFHSGQIGREMRVMGPNKGQLVIAELVYRAVTSRQMPRADRRAQEVSGEATKRVRTTNLWLSHMQATAHSGGRPLIQKPVHWCASAQHTFVAITGLGQRNVPNPLVTAMGKSDACR
jgi:hypothetical protein